MEEQGNQAALKNLFSGLEQKVHFVKYFFTKFYTVWHQAAIQENHFEKFCSIFYWNCKQMKSEVRVQR